MAGANDVGRTVEQYGAVRTFHCYPPARAAVSRVSDAQAAPSPLSPPPSSLDRRVGLQKRFNKTGVPALDRLPYIAARGASYPRCFAVPSHARNSTYDVHRVPASGDLARIANPRFRSARFSMTVNR